MNVSIAGAASPTLAGLLNYHDGRSGSRRPEPCLCTLQLEPQPVFAVTKLQDLLSAVDCTLCLDVRRVAISSHASDSALVFRIADNEDALRTTSDDDQHIFTATEDLGRDSISTWRQCLAAAGALTCCSSISSAVTDASSLAQWLQFARDGHCTRLMRAYRAQPTLLDARATTGARLGALHWAVAKASHSKHHRRCLNWLLHVGARTDLPDARPVLHAARTSEIARLLVAAGADPGSKDSLGRSASCAAREHGLHDLAEWLDGAVRRRGTAPVEQVAEVHDDRAGVTDTVDEREFVTDAVEDVNFTACPAAAIQYPQSLVIELRGLGVDVDGWYNLLPGDTLRSQRPPIYIRVLSEPGSRPAVLGYRRPQLDDGVGWWYIAATSMHELDQAANPEAVLTSRLVAVANDNASCPERICSSWKRITRTGQGTDSQYLPFCTEPLEAHDESKGLMTDVICCGTATISTSTLRLPLVHRTTVDFLLTTYQWNQLGLAAVVESDSSLIAAEIEGRSFLQAALNNVKKLRQSRQHEQVIGPSLAAEMVQSSPLSMQVTCHGLSEQQRQERQEQHEQEQAAIAELTQIRRWRRRCEQHFKNANC